MFLASRVCATADEAKAWVEANIAPDDRRHWVVLAAEEEIIDVFQKTAPEVQGVEVDDKDKPK